MKGGFIGLNWDQDTALQLYQHTVPPAFRYEASWELACQLHTRVFKNLEIMNNGLLNEEHLGLPIHRA
jgi:hypothetical protein